VPDLSCAVQDLLLEVVDLKQEVPDLRSPQFYHWLRQATSGSFNEHYHTIRYEMLFDVRSKADISQLNLPHGTVTKDFRQAGLRPVACCCTQGQLPPPPVPLCPHS